MTLNELEQADLQVRLDYPDGDVSHAAQLTIWCRKSNLIIAKIDMTEGDLVNFMARRVVGPVEGGSHLLAKRGREHLNEERVIVGVKLPHVVDVFAEGDDRHINAWAASAARAYGAQDTRVTSMRGGYTVGLMFYVGDRDSSAGYLEVVHRSMEEQAEKYIKAAEKKKAESR